MAGGGSNCSRRAFLRTGRCAVSMARAAGWWRGDGVPDRRDCQCLALRQCRGNLLSSAGQEPLHGSAGYAHLLSGSLLAELFVVAEDESLQFVMIEMDCLQIDKLDAGRFIHGFVAFTELARAEAIFLGTWRHMLGNLGLFAAAAVIGAVISAAFAAAVPRAGIMIVSVAGQSVL